MDALVATGGVTKKTIYDIYGSKDSPLVAAVSSCMALILVDIGKTAKGRKLKRLFSIIYVPAASGSQTARTV